MVNRNLLLITNNNETSDILARKLVLLRESDAFAVSNFENVSDIYPNLLSDVIFVEQIEEQVLFFDTVAYLKKINPNAVLIAFVQKVEQDSVLAMYDAGIDDYISPASQPFDILIKTVNALKLVDERKKAVRNEKLLSNLGAVVGGFYAEKFANMMMLEELNNDYRHDGVFIIVTCDEVDRAKLDADKFAVAVKNSLRASDVVLKINSSKFYIILPDTSVDGAVAVFGKIKSSLDADFRLKAGICEIGNKAFDELERKATVALTEAMLGASDCETYVEKGFTVDEEWIIEPEKDRKKDFKFFKQMFCKKLKNVITPVFANVQKEFEKLLDETKIEHYTDENQSVFHLKCKKQTSRLTLVYPGFAKVVIYTTHSGLDSPENKEISLPLKALTEESLSEILRSFIEDYRKCLDD